MMDLSWRWKGRATQVVQKAASLGKETANQAGARLHELSASAKSNRDRIAGTTDQALDTGGKVLDWAGQKMGRWAQAKALGNNDQSRSFDRIDQAKHMAVQAAFGTTQIVANGLSQIGKFTSKVAPGIGAAAGGMVTGIVEATSGAVDSIAISQADIDAMEQRCMIAGKLAQQHADRENALIQLAREQGRKEDLLDLLVVAGVTLAEALKNPLLVSPEVEKAFELAYPGLTRIGEHFTDAVARVPAENLIHLISGVKGKLFELELVCSASAPLAKKWGCG